MGADRDVFVGGDIGMGWIKTVYGDSLKVRQAIGFSAQYLLSHIDANAYGKKKYVCIFLQAMYTYDPSIKTFDDGSVALCAGKALRHA